MWKGPFRTKHRSLCFPTNEDTNEAAHVPAKAQKPVPRETLSPESLTIAFAPPSVRQPWQCGSFGNANTTRTRRAKNTLWKLISSLSMKSEKGDLTQHPGEWCEGFDTPRALSNDWKGQKCEDWFSCEHLEVMSLFAFVSQGPCHNRCLTDIYWNEMKNSQDF